CDAWMDVADHGDNPRTLPQEEGVGMEVFGTRIYFVVRRRQRFFGGERILAECSIQHCRFCNVRDSVGSNKLSIRKASQEVRPISLFMSPWFLDNRICQQFIQCFIESALALLGVCSLLPL